MLCVAKHISSGKVLYPLQLYIMTNAEENFDEDGNPITTDNDTVDYKELYEKEKAEREKADWYFKVRSKELNELKEQLKQPKEDEDDGINGANEYLKTSWTKVLREEWVIFKDEFEALLEQKMQQMRDIEKLDKFPNLASQKDAILQLSKVDWLSIEETIKKYKFVDEEWMENFHKPTIGSRKKTPWSINMENPTAEDLEMIKKMPPDEFNKFMGL